MGSLIPVGVGFAVVGVDLAGGHILGNIVVTLTRHTGDDDQRGVGEILGPLQQLGAVIGRGRLRQVPVLGRDGDRRAVLGVAEIELRQGGVHFKARVLDALDEADLVVQVVQAAGAGAAVDGVGGGPAEEIQALGVLKRQDALVLQKHKALLGDLGGDCLSLFGKVVRDRGGSRAAADQAQQCGHRPQADEVCHNDDHQQRGHPALAADEFFLGLGQLFHRHSHGDGCNKRHSDGDKVRYESLQYADQVFHLK